MPNKQNNTLSSLEYQIRVANYGYVNGVWTYIHKRKPLFVIDIELVDDTAMDLRYQHFLRQYYKPLAEYF